MKGFFTYMLSGHQYAITNEFWLYISQIVLFAFALGSSLIGIPLWMGCIFIVYYLNMTASKAHAAHIQCLQIVKTIALIESSLKITRALNAEGDMKQEVDALENMLTMEHELLEQFGKRVPQAIRKEHLEIMEKLENDQS